MTGFQTFMVVYCATCIFNCFRVRDKIKAYNNGEIQDPVQSTFLPDSWLDVAWHVTIFMVIFSGPINILVLIYNNLKGNLK